MKQERILNAKKSYGAVEEHRQLLLELSALYNKAGDHKSGKISITTLEGFYYKLFKYIYCSNSQTTGSSWSRFYSWTPGQKQHCWANGYQHLLLGVIFMMMSIFYFSRWIFLLRELMSSNFIFTTSFLAFPMAIIEARFWCKGLCCRWQ